VGPPLKFSLMAKADQLFDRSGPDAPSLARKLRRETEIGIAESPYSAGPRKCCANEVAKPSTTLTGLETI
jgi:hypothetical protein